MGQRGGMNRYGDKREAANKNDANAQMNQQQPGWGMYGQAGWNQAAANHYQNWAQYQTGKWFVSDERTLRWLQTCNVTPLRDCDAKQVLFATKLQGAKNYWVM